MTTQTRERYSLEFWVGRCRLSPSGWHPWRSAKTLAEAKRKLAAEKKSEIDRRTPDGARWRIVHRVVTSTSETIYEEGIRGRATALAGLHPPTAPATPPDTDEVPR